MNLLLQLILSHLLGDFVCQTKRWKRKKEAGKLRTPYFYVHITIYGILALALTCNWPVALLILAFHTGAELLRLYVRKVTYQRVWFWYDQLLHLVIIATIAGIASGHALADVARWAGDVFPEIVAIVFLTVPASVMVEHTISRWKPQVKENESASLERAGAYIGVLERLFVFGFVISGQWSAVGFLLAAKSVFRFGDLKDAKDRKLTEYILIGTLMSIGLASIAGLLVRGLTV